jgi:hypothetical protein
MEVYTLNSLHQTVDVIDKFESLIWTERYSAWGDFELMLFSTNENRKLFTEGTRITVNDSYWVMTVDTVEDTVDEDGGAFLKIKGRSMESILESRLARDTMVGLTSNPKWILSGTPKEIAEGMFRDVCIYGYLNAGDIIPSVNETSFFPADTIPPPPDVITYEVDPKTLYTAIKELCDLYNMGFRLVRSINNPQLYFNIYTGSDRTSHQSGLPAVIFSQSLENLKKTTELKSTALYKNVAYVLSPVGTQVVYGADVDPLISGFDRKVLLVKADDITDTDPAVAATKMIRRGNEELGKNRRYSAFDGELSQYSSYVYGVDYNLGDLVEVQSSSGANSSMQVTEHIRVADKEGERSYPTLTINEFIMPGTWAARPTDQVWGDLLTETWADQP